MMDSTQTTIDLEALEGVLMEIARKTLQSSSETAKSAAENEQPHFHNVGGSPSRSATIGDLVSTPAVVIMKVLASRLLEESEWQLTEEMEGVSSEEPDQGRMTSVVALGLVRYLVQVDPDRYLEAAAQAIRDRTVQMSQTLPQSSSSPNNIMVDLIPILVTQIVWSEYVQVSTLATEALLACCRRWGLAVASQAVNLLIEAWKNTLRPSPSLSPQKASVFMIRCISTLVDIGNLNDACMELVWFPPLQQEMFLQTLLDDSDPLVQISLIDVLERMATTLPMHAQRARWLCSPAVLRPILLMAGGASDDDDPDPMTGGPALRLVAALCTVKAAMSSPLSATAQADDQEDLLVQGLYRALHKFPQSGEKDRLALLHALSSFASLSDAACNLVLNDPVTREAWLSLNVAQSKLKSAVLYSVAQVIDPALCQNQVDPNVESNWPVMRISPSQRLKLFQIFGQQNVSDGPTLAMTMARSPLPEIRMGAYALLMAVVQHIPSGAQLLFLQGPSFMEFLLDRQRETTKEGRDAKYDLVKAIVNGPLGGVLAEDIVKQLQLYLNQGAHYVQSIPWELATED